MTAYRWVAGQKGGGGGVDDTSAEWEEHWTVYGYAPPMGEPAWTGLLRDQPMLRPGQRHYNAAFNAKVVNFDCDRLGTVADAWEAVVRYRTETATNDPNPLNQPAEIDLDSESEEVPVVFDADGKPILNTAGDLVAGLTEEESRWIFNLAVNLPSIPREILEYRNAVNNDAVRIGGLTIEPGYLLLKNPRAGKVERAMVNGQEVAYVPFSYSVVYHPRTWIKRFFNMGLNEWIEEDVPSPTEEDPRATRKRKRKVRITIPNRDGDDVEVDEPMFLDRDGTVPRERIPRIDPTTGEPEKDEQGNDAYDLHPRRLDPDEIIVLEKWTKKRLPFNRLPGMR